ncbi:MAG: Hsp20/alpha crystallin family protein [Candidatus Sumerlaeia bacterium]
MSDISEGMEKRFGPQSPRREGSGTKSVFDNVFSSQHPFFSLSKRVWNPPADVYETSTHVVIKMEVAGVCRDRLQITAEGNALRICGCRAEEGLPKENYHVMEIRYGAFERIFDLPFKIDSEAIAAQYSNGFLIINIPKTKPVSRQIEIETTDEEI